MGCTILVHGVELDNCRVVPHNVYLSTKYDAHINVKVCNNICEVEYLFKYIYKRHDHVTIEISRKNNNATKENVVKANEIKKYLNCCYVSTSEIMWHNILPLSVCNTIYLVNKWCCSMMMMMCRKWLHNQPFPERC